MNPDLGSNILLETPANHAVKISVSFEKDCRRRLNVEQCLMQKGVQMLQNPNAAIYKVGTNLVDIPNLAWSQSILACGAQKPLQRGCLLYSDFPCLKMETMTSHRVAASPCFFSMSNKHSGMVAAIIHKKSSSLFILKGTSGRHPTA